MEAHLYVRHYADVAGTATKSSSGRFTKSQYSASGIMADTNNIQRLGENRAAELAELRGRTAALGASLKGTSKHQGSKSGVSEFLYT